MAMNETLRDRLYALILEDAKEKGYSLRSTNWYKDQLGCRRREDVKDALNDLTNEKLIRRKTIFDDEGFRRCKVIPVKQKEAKDAE